MDEKTPLLERDFGERADMEQSVWESHQNWRRLADIDDSNTTAKDMASDTRFDLDILNHRVVLPSQDAPVQSNKWLRLALPEQTDTMQVASMFIMDGIHGRKIGYRLDPVSLWLRREYHTGRYRLVYSIAVLTCCGLALVESPGNSLDKKRVCIAVEAFLMSLFCMDIWIRWTMSSVETRKKFIARQPWAFVRGIIILTMLVDISYFVSNHYTTWRPTRALRPFLLIARLRNVRIIFSSCLHAFRKILVVLSLLACVICFWGLVGYLVFSDYSQDLPHRDYFATLSKSLYTMLLIHTSIPYMTQAMSPYYHLSQWSAVYFVVFVILSNLFLVKLIIAVSYKSYKLHTETMLFKRLQKRKVALYSAFQLLAEDPPQDGIPSPQPSIAIEDPPTEGGVLSPDHRDLRKVSISTWLDVADYLRPDWNEMQRRLVFNSVDIDRTGYVGVQEFYQLCSLATVTVERGITTLPPPFGNWQRAIRGVLLKGFVWGKIEIIYAEIIVGMLIILSVVQAIQVNYLKLAFSSHHAWRVLGMVLLSLFTLEVLLKIFAYGWRGFRNRPFCLLDLWIVSVGWTFYVITSATAVDSALLLYNLALAVRVLRVIKLLNLIPQFREILWTMSLILPLVLRLLGVILSIIYAFTILAQDFYGVNLHKWYLDDITIPQWNIYELDTFSHTLLTMFHVAVLSGWISVMNNAAAASAVAFKSWCYVFFFTYRIVISQVLMPIFVGFVVESFVTHVKSVESKMAVLAHFDSTPLSPNYSETDYKLRRKRKNSDVNNAMFDIAEQSDLRRLHGLLNIKNLELAQKDAQTRRMEATILRLRQRLRQSQEAVITKEAQLELFTTKKAPVRRASHK